MATVTGKAKVEADTHVCQYCLVKFSSSLKLQSHFVEAHFDLGQENTMRKLIDGVQQRSSNTSEGFCVHNHDSYSRKDLVKLGNVDPVCSVSPSEVNTSRTKDSGDNNSNHINNSIVIPRTTLEATSMSENAQQKRSYFDIYGSYDSAKELMILSEENTGGNEDCSEHYHYNDDPTSEKDTKIKYHYGTDDDSLHSNHQFCPTPEVNKRQGMNCLPQSPLLPSSDKDNQGMERRLPSGNSEAGRAKLGKSPLSLSAKGQEGSLTGRNNKRPARKPPVPPRRLVPTNSEKLENSPDLTPEAVKNSPFSSAVEGFEKPLLSSDAESITPTSQSDRWSEKLGKMLPIAPDSKQGKNVSPRRPISPIPRDEKIARKPAALICEAQNQLPSQQGAPQEMLPSPHTPRPLASPISMDSEYSVVTCGPSTPPSTLPHPRERPFPQPKAISMDTAVMPGGKDSQVRTLMPHWYQPDIPPKEAMELVRSMKSPGSFIVRDSGTVQGGYALVVKFSEDMVRARKKLANNVEVTKEMLVSQFLIKPGPKGLKLQGPTQEHTFEDLPSLIESHMKDKMSLSCKLVLSVGGMTGHKIRKQLSQNQITCEVVYIGSVGVFSPGSDSLLTQTVQQLQASNHSALTIVTITASREGVALKGNFNGVQSMSNISHLEHQYTFSSITYCGVDPVSRWTFSPLQSRPEDKKDLTDKICFGMVVRRPKSSGYTCIVFAEYDSSQPISSVVNFFQKMRQKCLSKS